MTAFERHDDLGQAQEERLHLMRRMAEVSGARNAFDLRRRADPTLQAIVQECTRCQQAQTCASWLADAQKPSPPPVFCPNAIPFRYLASWWGRGVHTPD